MANGEQLEGDDIAAISLAFSEISAGLNRDNGTAKFKGRLVLPRVLRMNPKAETQLIRMFERLDFKGFKVVTNGSSTTVSFIPH